MNFVAAGLTDVGLQREHNEDAYSILPHHSLFVVADGMGGHRAGDVASQMAIHTMESFFDATKNEDATWPFSFDPHLSIAENRLVTSIKLANRRIYEASVKDESMHGMGTTVVGALFSKEADRFYFAHVGDSRAYRVRGGEIAQLTRDHSLVNDFLRAIPDMPEDQRAEIPTNVITRALGMQNSVAVDMVPDPPKPGDVYVLCSDGLNGMISDAEIAEVVAAAGEDMEKAAKGLIDAANKKGGEDNITVATILCTA